MIISSQLPYNLCIPGIIIPLSYFKKKWYSKMSIIIMTIILAVSYRSRTNVCQEQYQEPNVIVAMEVRDY